MIALLQVAAAGTLTPCDTFRPIAGTAGFSNALSAVRTNSQTYGAATFARERLTWDTLIAMDFHIIANAASVPTSCADTEGKYAGDIFAQPLDLGATNLGFALPFVEDGPLNSKFRAYYASSVTQSLIGQRAASWSLPLFNLYPAAFAPVVGRSNAGRSVQRYAVDYVAGAYFGSDVVSVQAGYTGTRGLYLDVRQEQTALFFDTVFGDGEKLTFGTAAYLLAGLQGLDPVAFGADEDGTAGIVGVTSLFYRDLPQSDAVAANDGAGEERTVFSRLQTGNLRQEDLWGQFDVRASIPLNQPGLVRELTLAAHSPGWHPRRFREPLDGEYRLYYVRAGFVNLPDQPLFGVKGGVRPTARADFALYNDGAAMSVRASLRYNDPDLLDLYPFAYDSLGFNLELTTSLSQF